MTHTHTNTVQALSPDDLVNTLGKSARAASRKIAQIPDETINAVLKDIAQQIRTNAADIIKANDIDVRAGRDKGLTDALIDRLTLNAERVDAMASGLETVASLPNPIGRTLWEETRPNGLEIKKVSVPIGVLGMIYESRPNVTIDAAALCLKSRNAVILRGGSESLNSSLALHKIIATTLDAHALPAAAVSMIPTSDRAAVGAMLACHQYIDVMIPRGGRSLIERIMNEAKMPVFGHLEGLCHIYVHDKADATIAREVTLNAKMRRTGVCGAVETILIDEHLDDGITQDILTTLSAAHCEIVGDTYIQSLNAAVSPATDDDYVTEYLAPKVSIKRVKNIDEAINHINTLGSHHTDSILTQDDDAAQAFLNQVDSGIVLHNASTQFADGGEFGMGAEIGIATGKMHARGPVGVEQLCTYKYHVHGKGQTRP